LPYTDDYDDDDDDGEAEKEKKEEEKDNTTFPRAFTTQRSNPKRTT